MFFVSALFHDGAEVEDRDARHHIEHDVHVVLDEEDRERGIEALQELGHLARFARGEARGRLVQQQQLRVARQSEHHLDLALLAVREVAHFDVAPVPVAGRLEQLLRLFHHVLVGREAFPHHELRAAHAGKREQHVVEHGELRGRGS